METINPYQSPAADVSARPNQGAFDESNPLSPKGRFGRLSYLAWGILLAIPVWIIAMIIGVSAAMVGAQEPDAMNPALLALQFIVMIPMIMFAIRRLHDFDASGWWAILFIIPIANLVLGLVLMLRRGTEGANRFAPPRITRGWEKVLGYIGIGFMVLAVVGIIAAIAIPAMVAR